jgi:hypothetical protein
MQPKPVSVLLLKYFWIVTRPSAALQASQVTLVLAVHSLKRKRIDQIGLELMV